MDEVGVCVKANREDAGRGTVSWGDPEEGGERRSRAQAEAET